MHRNRTSVGLDVHARSVVACGLDGQTGELFERRLCPDHNEIISWIRGLPGPVGVTYEAGPTGFGLARFLTSRSRSAAFRVSSEGHQPPRPARTAAGPPRSRPGRRAAEFRPLVGVPRLLGGCAPAGVSAVSQWKTSDSADASEVTVLRPAWSNGGAAASPGPCGRRRRPSGVWPAAGRPRRVGRSSRPSRPG